MLSQTGHASCGIRVCPPPPCCRCRRADGPLRAAVRSGAWVLLDELNLAGQTVLEGLNAVLDHRSEVSKQLCWLFFCGAGAGVGRGSAVTCLAASRRRLGGTSAGWLLFTELHALQVLLPCVLTQSSPFPSSPPLLLTGVHP